MAHIGDKNHFWCYQGIDKQGNEYSMCERCGKWRKNGKPIPKIEVPEKRQYK